MLIFVACVTTLVYKQCPPLLWIIRRKNKLEMKVFPKYCLAVLVLSTLGTVSQTLLETSNEKDVFSNFFHLNPPIHEDIKGKGKA